MLSISWMIRIFDLVTNVKNLYLVPGIRALRTLCIIRAIGPVQALFQNSYWCHMSHAAEFMTERFKANSETNEKVTIECLGNTCKNSILIWPSEILFPMFSPGKWLHIICNIKYHLSYIEYTLYILLREGPAQGFTSFIANEQKGRLQDYSVDFMMATVLRCWWVYDYVGDQSIESVTNISNLSPT